MRLADAKLVCQSDGRPWFLHDSIPSDGRWRILIFIGDCSRNASLSKQMNDIGAYLNSEESFIKRYTSSKENIDKVIEVLLIHASDIHSIEWNDFPPAFRPRNPDHRMDYWEIYSDNGSLHYDSGNAYAKYGIDKDVGAMLVLRPDGYVSKVATPDLEGIQEVAVFFERFMIPQQGCTS